MSVRPGAAGRAPLAPQPPADDQRPQPPADDQRPRASERRRGRLVCGGCGAPLQADQEWCVECGTARTIIHRAPDWRIPIAIIATVILLVVAGLAVALFALSSETNRATAARTSPAPLTQAQQAQPAPHARLGHHSASLLVTSRVSAAPPALSRTAEPTTAGSANASIVASTERARAPSA